ncbi:MAG TPA: hypothetical protein VFF52_20600 [Isosphaeraceae bacterium]|nr:hypothetical protein [Isosphaeraceae bacterium]
MISTRVKPTRRTPPQPRRNDGSPKVFHDPALLSTTLRELAVRAHRAVRASQALRSNPQADADRRADSDRELSELHARIVQLQGSIHSQSLSGLAPYVEALRQKVLLVLGP